MIMTTARPMPWIAQASALLERVATTQAEPIEQASQWCADAITADGLVHLFGTGHSRIPLEEMFPRYGSYPGWRPIAELSMTFHTQIAGANGQRQAMFIERVEGLAEQILANFVLDPADVMVVFSASGTGAAPIEMAMGARRRGLAWWPSPAWRSRGPAPAAIPRARGCTTTPTWSSTCAPRAPTRWCCSTAWTRRSGPGRPWPTPPS